MAVIYILTSGSYSDYGINAVFSTKEKAEQYIEYVNKIEKYPEDYAIEEYILDPIPDRVYRENLKPFRLQMYKDGNIRQIDSSTPDREQIYFSKYGILSGKKGDESVVMCLEIYTKSEEHAIKIAGEKRRQIIAEGKWPTLKQLEREEQQGNQIEVST